MDTTTHFEFDSGRVVAISRGLSGAIPSVQATIQFHFDPGGVASSILAPIALISRLKRDGPAPLPGCEREPRGEAQWPKAVDSDRQRGPARSHDCPTFRKGGGRRGR